MKQFRSLILALSLLLVGTVVEAKGPGTTTGLSLLRMGGARSIAMGEAFSAASNDITALDFNAGSLASLEGGQASLQYKDGLVDDSFSKAMIGANMAGGSLGVSAGFYNSGDVTLFDGVTTKSVTAEEDWVANIGYGRSIGPFDVGLNVKYISIRLADQFSDSATSLEAGVQIPFWSRFRFGLSGPLVQSKIKFASEEEDLPQLYRAGLAAHFDLNLPTGIIPFNLLLDVPYDAQQSETSVAGGAEARLGSLSLRGGANSSQNAINLFLGAGFSFSRFDVDYSFGMADSGFNSQHNVSLSMRFLGGESQEISQKPVIFNQTAQHYSLGSPVNE